MYVFLFFFYACLFFNKLFMKSTCIVENIHFLILQEIQQFIFLQYGTKMHGNFLAKIDFSVFNTL